MFVLIMLDPTDLSSPCLINGSKRINTRLSQRKAPVDKVSALVYLLNSTDYSVGANTTDRHATSRPRGPLAPSTSILNQSCALFRPSIVLLAYIMISHSTSLPIKCMFVRVRFTLVTFSNPDLPLVNL